MNIDDEEIDEVESIEEVDLTIVKIPASFGCGCRWKGRSLILRRGIFMCKCGKKWYLDFKEYRKDSYKTLREKGVEDIVINKEDNKDLKKL